MAVSGSFTNLTAGLKRRYDDSFAAELAWSKGEAAALVKRVAGSGEQIAYSMRVGNSPSRSATFSVVKAKSESATGYTRIVQPRLSWKRDYGRATIDGLLIKAAGDKLGSLYDRFVAQVDGIMDATMHSLSTKIYRDGFGCVGNISATTTLASTTLNLAVREDAVLFEVGNDVVLSASNAANTLRNAGAVGTITGIDYNLGNLTFASNISAIWAAAALGDFIFLSGDRQDSATPTRLAITGFDAWLPTTAPSGGENFNNLDRSTDGKLVGVVVNALNKSEEEAIIDAVTDTGRLGGKGRHVFLNPTRYANLIKQGMGRYRPTTVKGPAGIGFDGVVVQTPNGRDVEVYADLFCPRKRGYLIEMESWQIYGAGTNKIPFFLMEDGNKILRMTDEDGYEARVGYYAEMGCDAPCHNAVMQFET